MEKKSRYTAAQNRATQKYHAEHMEIVTFRTQKSERFNDLVSAAAKQSGQSKAQYMHDAIKTRLDDDGITLDSLQ